MEELLRRIAELWNYGFAEHYIANVLEIEEEFVKRIVGTYKEK